MIEISDTLHGRLLLKKELLSANNSKHEEIRPLLLNLAGGMQCASSAGTLMGLSESHLDKVFDTVVGISAGGPILSYFLNGRQGMNKGSHIYTNILTDKFIRPERLLSQPDTVIDYEMFEKVLTSGDYAIDMDELHNHRSDFYCTAANMQTAKTEFFNLKQTDNFINTLNATGAMPIVSRKVLIQGVHFIDGATIDPLPLEELVARHNPTDMLIITNREHSLDNKATNQTSWFETEVAKLLFKSRDIANHLKKKPERLQRSLQFAQNHPTVNFGFIWAPESSVRTYHRSVKDVQKLHDDSLEEIRDFLK